MSGEVVYFELPGNDTDAAQRFWGGLFGWEFHAGNAPDYSMIAGSSPMAGIPHGQSARHPRVYFGADDLDAATDRVREFGGTTGEPVAIPAGRFAHCTDDQGVEFSLFEAA